MLNDLKHILNGWKNYLDKSEVTETTAKQRAAVCAACPHAKQGKLLAFGISSIWRRKFAESNVEGKWKSRYRNYNPSGQDAYS